MENFDQPLDLEMAPSKDDGLRITPEVRQYWREISAWAMFFAVLLFIVVGLVAMMGLVMVFTAGAAGIFVMLMVGVYAVLVFLPAYYYYLFSSQMKQALRSEDNRLLDQAFTNLKRFYRFVGIFVIVFISLYLLAILIFGAAFLGGGGLPTE